MRGLASLVREDRAQSIENVWGPQWGEYPTGGTYSGKAVTNTSALQLLAVYGSVRFIADGIATLPIDVYRNLPDGTREPVSVPAWLEKPAPGLDRVAWMTQILTSLLLDGNAYLFMTLSQAGLQLIPLDPSAVTPAPSVNGRQMWIIGGQMVDGSNIVHIPGIMFPGSRIGLSPVECARQTIGQGLAAQEYSSRAVGQSFSAPGVIETAEPLTPDNAKALARNAARQHTGPDKMNLPLVLVNATWKPIGVTNEQAQFLESRQFTDAQIAGEMFLIDPSELGIGVAGTSLTYANLEQRATRRVQVTFLPWIVRIENAISDILARPRFMKINANGLLRGDLKTRYESYQIGTGGKPFILPSEARSLEDLPPVDGIDDQPPAAPAVPQENE
jgi:HK97 family phage portal protein